MSAHGSIPSTVRKPTRLALFCRDPWTLALLQRLEGLVTWHSCEDVVEIPLSFGICGRLDLGQVKVMDELPILAHSAAPSEEVIDRHLSHLGNDGFWLRQFQLPGLLSGSA